MNDITKKTVKDKTDPFETYEEFCDNIQRGGEVEFMYAGKAYSVTHVENGILIGAQSCDDKDIVVQTINNISKIVIDGEPFDKIIIKAEILFRCF